MTEAKLQAWLNNPDTRNTRRGKAALYLQAVGSAPTNRIAQHISASINTTAARLSELQADGYIVPMYPVKGYTLWRWEYDSSKWASNANRHTIEKAKTKLEGLLKNEVYSKQFKAAMEREIALLNFATQTNNTWHAEQHGKTTTTTK